MFTITSIILGEAATIISYLDSWTRILTIIIGREDQILIDHLQEGILDSFLNQMLKPFIIPKNLRKNLLEKRLKLVSFIKYGLIRAN